MRSRKSSGTTRNNPSDDCRASSQTAHCVQWITDCMDGRQIGRTFISVVYWVYDGGAGYGERRCGRGHGHWDVGGFFFCFVEISVLCVVYHSQRIKQCRLQCANSRLFLTIPSLSAPSGTLSFHMHRSTSPTRSIFVLKQCPF
jgi:hypothetical protein